MGLARAGYVAQAQRLTADMLWVADRREVALTVAGVLEAERGFRKLAGYRALPTTAPGRLPRCRLV